MPLKLGNDRETVEENIGELVRSGRPRAQAAAIAYKAAGKYSGPKQKADTDDKDVDGLA